MNGRDGRPDPRKAEGRFLLDCLEDEPHQNGFVIATPGGNRLACCSAAVEDGLRKWEALAEAERLPGAVKVEERPEGLDPAHLEPPPGALVVKTYVRGIERQPDGGLRREASPAGRDREDTVEREEPGRDHLWLLEPEWRSLLPPRAVEGETYEVPAAVADRIARFHVIPTTAQVGGITPPWRPEEVRERDLALTVEEATPERIRLRLDGAVLLARGAGDFAGSRFGFAARFLGFLEVDRRKEVIDRFDAVALGETRGARPWRTLAGVAFELARPDSPGGGRLVAPYFAVDHNPYGSRERYLATGLSEWLENMVRHHRYAAEEVAAATGLDLDAARRAIAEHGLAGNGAAPPHRAGDGKVLVLPYPGGRHPRIGFLDGAIDPRRDTKASIFLPWEDAGHAVVDLPEALWSNLGLTFLAHTHIPTVWDQRGMKLPPGEWRRAGDGSLANAFVLPNGIRIEARIAPREDAADLELRVRNGTAETLTGLRTQVCIMLKGAKGFTAQTNDNKVMAGRAIAARSADGRRWIVTAWERARPWANPPVPCIHSDPTFPDLEPGEESVLRGRIFFHEGEDIHAEIARREREGTLDGAPATGSDAPPELVSVKRIWDAAPHNAFTDLVRLDDPTDPAPGGSWICAFREGAAHVSPDGAIRVIASRDGEDWTSLARIESAGGDLRDPKLAVTPAGRLQLTAASALRQPAASRHQTFTWLSKDGADWGEPIPIGEPDSWIWRVAWHAGAAWGVGYATDGRRNVRLYRSADGVKFEVAAASLFDGGEPSEASLAFLPDGTCLCLLRRDDPGGNGQLGRAAPPYVKWAWKDLGVRIGGPAMIRLEDGRLIAAVRLHDPVRTSLAWLPNDPAGPAPDEGKLRECLRLPSGGDTSYAGLVEHDGLLWVSYYSSHEGKASIYLARVKLPGR